MIRKIVILVLVSLSTTSCASLLGESQHQKRIDRRVQRLEARTAQLDTLRKRVDNISSISQNAGNLQSELRDLRGQIQDLKHQLAILKDQQRQQYLDLDRRIQGRTGGASHASASAIQGSQGDNGRVRPGEKQAYLKAFNLMKNSRYKQSVEAFKSFLKQYPQGRYADNAHYWLGEVHYVEQDLKPALEDFQKVVKQYPKSSKAPGSLLKIASIYNDQGDKAKARKYFSLLQDKYPGSSAAAQAGKQLAGMGGGG